ncbi:LPXTG cell wall anchor domain-containing protein [Lactiplantibacillus carotarum]|uniref:LPXTG cell wall anchor domain-containing protein n=1 Tax=Lactiplantibacillus carotarum TaxID=2993456 RepID=UPI00298EDB2E|nr:LPXTG cell wall anchor domain-containing protein [Lactiplantibacillus carotarum]
MNGTTNEVVNVARDVPADYQLAKGVSGQLTLALDATVPMTVNVGQVQKTYTVNFVNAQGDVVKTMSVNGTTGEHVDVSTDVPSDYQLADGVSGQLTLALDAATTIIVPVVTKPVTSNAGSQASQAGSNTSSQVSQAGSNESQPVSTGSQATSETTSTAQPGSTGSQSTSAVTSAAQPASTGSQAGQQSVASQATSTASQAGNGQSAASAVTSTTSQAGNGQSATSAVTSTTSQAASLASEDGQSRVPGQLSAGMYIDPITSISTQPVAQPATQTRATSVKVASAAVAVKSAAPRPATASQSANTLPQTNEHSANWAVSLGLTALVGLIGLAGLAKLERHDN